MTVAQTKGTPVRFEFEYVDGETPEHFDGFATGEVRNGLEVFAVDAVGLRAVRAYLETDAPDQFIDLADEFDTLAARVDADGTVMLWGFVTFFVEVR
jgi:hypothetical protein